jgi:hypothetical protein
MRYDWKNPPPPELLEEISDYLEDVNAHALNHLFRYGMGLGNGMSDTDNERIYQGLVSAISQTHRQAVTA